MRKAEPTHEPDQYLTMYGAIFEMELDDWLDPSLPTNVPSHDQSGQGLLEEPTNVPGRNHNQAAKACLRNERSSRIVQ